MQIRNKLLISLCAVLCASCATVELTEKAGKIQVHDQMSTLLANCKNLGPVKATVKDDGSDTAISAAKIAAREKVADMGGDTLVVVNTDRWRESTGSIPLFVFKVEVQGAAMRCY